MRGRLAVLALLALGLSACGGGSNDNKISKPVAANGQVAASASSGAKQTTGASSAAAPQAKAAPSALKAATYLAPTRVVKTNNGATPAVVLLPDTGKKAAAIAEAGKLADLGVATMVVEGPAAAPSKVAAFNRAVDEAQLAIATLRKRKGIDPARVGVIGEGVGAHIGAVAIGRAPDSVHAAVLADIGGVVVPSPKFAPERWLERAPHTTMLFQRDSGGRAMTQAEVTRLMVAAPPGTLLQEYKDLGGAAQATRDKWIKAVLLVG